VLCCTLKERSGESGEGGLGQNVGLTLKSIHTPNAYTDATALPFCIAEVREQ
jgi:hypothetical protein